MRKRARRTTPAAIATRKRGRMLGRKRYNERKKKEREENSARHALLRLCDGDDYSSTPRRMQGTEVRRRSPRTVKPMMMPSLTTPAAGGIEAGGKGHKAGDKLCLNWHGSGDKVFHATIINISESEAPTYELRYNDGGFVWDIVPASMIQPGKMLKVNDKVRAKWRTGDAFLRAKIVRVHGVGRTIYNLRFTGEGQQEECCLSSEELQTLVVVSPTI